MNSRKDKMRIHLEQVHSKDGSEFYKLPSEEARDVKPTLPLPLPQHPLPIEVVNSAIQQQQQQQQLQQQSAANNAT